MVAGFLGAHLRYWSLVQEVHALNTISRRTYAVEAKRAQRQKVEEILAHVRQSPHEDLWHRANINPLDIPTRER